MYNYDVGGNVAPKDPSGGAIANIDQNRTLFVQKLTDEDPVRPEAVYDLTSTSDVFEHFKPHVGVEFENAEGGTVKQDLQFNNLGDFGPKNITQQSKFLTELNTERDQYQKTMKQLKTNKLMINVLNNPESKAAFIGALNALIQELDSNN